jgi:two-component system sensor histidine kinase RegB
MTVGELHGDTSRSFLRLLSNLRWLAVVGQAITIVVVTGPVGVELPLTPLWAGVSALALFNAYATYRVSRPQEAGAAEMFLHLAVDVTVLTWQVGWSGGIENPFSSLFLLPIALSILALPSVWIWVTAAASLAGFAFSASLAHPLPHVHGALGDTFNLHKAGMLVNFLISAAVLLVFFTRLASLRRANEAELAALRERFTRNEGILALATHAASVAHELNTPLATLTLIVDELSEPGASAPKPEDCANMRMLIEQCRDRVRALAAPAKHAGSDHTHVDIEEIIDRWRLVRPTIELMRSGNVSGSERIDVSAGHLLQALLNNAADAGEMAGDARVALRLDVNGTALQGEIRDYGRGFGDAAPLLPGTLFRTNKPEGLGIGLALSHATVERLGGELTMHAPENGPGVRVVFRLPGTVKT